jgi:hypothetical protein
MAATKEKPKKAVTQSRDWRPKFLHLLASEGVVSSAANLCGVHLATVYRERERNPEFGDAWKAALDVATDTMEREARRRAIEGVNEPVVYQGQLAYVAVDAKGEYCPPDAPGARLIPLTVKKFSDTLLIFLLKGRRPEVFGDKATITHDGSLRTQSDGESAAVQILDGIATRLGVKRGGSDGDSQLAG